MLRGWEDSRISGVMRDKTTKLEFDRLKDNALSLSTFRRQLKHFYFLFN